jgi:hypothetical protein
MFRGVRLVKVDVSVERVASIFRVEEITRARKCHTVIVALKTSNSKIFYCARIHGLQLLKHPTASFPLRLFWGSCTFRHQPHLTQNLPCKWQNKLANECWMLLIENASSSLFLVSLLLKSTWDQPSAAAFVNDGYFPRLDSAKYIKTMVREP